MRRRTKLGMQLAVGTRELPVFPEGQKASPTYALAIVAGEMPSCSATVTMLAKALTRPVVVGPAPVSIMRAILIGLPVSLIHTFRKHLTSPRVNSVCSPLGSFVKSQSSFMVDPP